MTYSLAAFDRATGQLGVVVQSCAFSVGSRVAWAEPGVGAMATQANTNAHYGPNGLRLLRDGLTPDGVIKKLTTDDDGRKIRQVGLVDAQGRAANYTGDNCLPWAGGLTGDGWACQGNILAGPQVVEAMARAYTTAQGSLAERLLAALEAGQEAGGDTRGMQSAALLVVSAEASDHPEGRLIDLRVDDHHQPIEELKRLYHVWRKGYQSRHSEWLEYKDVHLAVEQLMQQRGIPSLQKLAEALGVPDGVRGSKISLKLYEAVAAERKK